ncbi:hypothetical protein [Devosia sp. RR2S18]|jgi:hypothetical protein|uniref:hypothetical protein n=1 Tax=Devosia rhizosphaerae TaxID=3049774 RepID=UPI00254181F1|nr:hypothetical protein [Devosia sp. RR2S18]WIJ26753.1 hypothetical protein QOV41_08380 [Devosia sp. RR2S18]HEV7292839.1 hypothetical protein [Devosia sp.]
MTAQHYIVARHEGQWKVSFHGTDQGPFPSKDEAVEVAITDAQTLHERGLDVEVLVQDIDSSFRTAWSSKPGGGEAEDLGSTA